MKNKTFNLIITGAVIFASVVMMSCKGNKQAVQQTVQQTAPVSHSRSPFAGNTHEPPCVVYDDDKNFAATGIAYGAQTQLGSVQQLALENAQNMIYAKMEHAYGGFIDNYIEAIGTKQGTDIETEIRGVGRRAIMQVVKNTSASCIKFSDVDDKGNVQCFVAVKIPKEKVSQEIANNLSKSQKGEIRERAAAARKEMQEYFKGIKEE